MKRVFKPESKKDPKILGVGLLGCGRIASQHLAAITGFPECFRLAAVCDSVKERARKIGRQYRVPFYTDYLDLLKRKDVDLAVICTPNGLHYPMARAAALAGKHVLVEKPLAINLKEADDLINIFQKAKKELLVVMQVRYNEALRALKQAIRDGKFGKIYNATLTIRWARPQSYFKEAAWRGTKKLDGGALLNQGVHYIDAFLWLLGEVEEVFGIIDRVAHDIETEDEAFALLKFKKRAYGLIEFTICAYPRNLECSITLLGEKGTAKIGGRAVDEIEFWEVENCPKPEITEAPIPGFAGSSPNHFYVYRDVANLFLTGEKAFFDGREARKSLEIIEAIHRSARQNNKIKLSHNKNKKRI